jgi:hypothetical protein
MHLSDVHADMIERIDIMEEEVREPFAAPETQGRQIEQPLDMRVLAHQVPLVREDKGEMQEGRRRQIPAEQKHVRQDMRGLKIKDGHEETKPDYTEAQKPPTAWRVRAEQKDQRSHAELPQRHQQRQAKLHGQPSPGGLLDRHDDIQFRCPTVRAIGQRRAYRRAA